MRYSSPVFTVGSPSWELMVTLTELSSWTGVSVTVQDLWGGGERVLR